MRPLNAQIISPEYFIATVLSLPATSVRTPVTGYDYVIYALENDRMREFTDNPDKKWSSYIIESICPKTLQYICNAFKRLHPNFDLYNSKSEDEKFFEEIERISTPWIPDSCVTKKLCGMNPKQNKLITLALCIILCVEIPFRFLLHTLMKGVVSLCYDPEMAAYLKFKLSLNQTRPLGTIIHKLFFLISG